MFSTLVALEHGVVPGGHSPFVRLGLTASTKAEPARLPQIILPSMTDMSTEAIGSITRLK